jgi:HAMP domain-containing protein
MADKFEQFEKEYLALTRTRIANAAFALGYANSKEKWQEYRVEVMKDVRKQVKLLQAKGVPSAKIPADDEFDDLAKELHLYDAVLAKADTFAKNVSLPLAKAAKNLETQLAAEVKSRGREVSTVLKVGNKSLKDMRLLLTNVKGFQTEGNYKAIVAITAADISLWRKAIQTAVPNEITAAIKGR